MLTRRAASPDVSTARARRNPGSCFPGSHSAWLRAPDAPAIPDEPLSLRRIRGEVEDAGQLVQIHREEGGDPVPCRFPATPELIGQDVVALPAPFPPPGRGVPVFGQVSLVLRTVSVAVRAIRRPGASVPRTYGGQRRRGECHSAAFAQVRGYVMGTGSSGL